jgi:hypothetical protein
MTKIQYQKNDGNSIPKKITGGAVFAFIGTTKFLQNLSSSNL